MSLGFIFGGNTGETQASLKRKREVAQALLESSTSRVPQNVGEGLASIGQALAGRFAMNRLAKQEGVLNDYNSGIRSRIGAALFGDAPGAVSAPGQATVADALTGVTAKADNPNLPSRFDFARAERAPARDIRGGILETANALGIDPIDLGTAISYETAGTFDPTKRGPTTQWGQHKGLIQFGEPQAKKYGVDWDDPIGSQLGADGAVANYLRDTGVKPGMGMMDIYSAINAGGVGRYNASDANNGGAPGTVADKVNDQMAGHRKKAMTLLGDTQVASLDPSIGLPAMDPYANIPTRDGRGEDQRAKFREWNSDPIANHDANLAGIDPALAGVVRRAKEISGTDFIMGSGQRDNEMQRKAMDWGWSKTADSDHIGGGAADLWPLDNRGAVTFDPQRQMRIVDAMKQAAREKGVDIEAGADWKNFQDRPHFGMIGQTPMLNAPVPTARPGQPVQVASLDPSVGVPQAYAPQERPQQAAGAFARYPTPGIASTPPVAPMPPVQPTFVNDDGWQGQYSGLAGFPPAPPPPQFPSAPQQYAGGGPSMQELYSAYSDPRADDNTRAFIEMAIRQKQDQEEREREQNDPSRLLDMEYKRAQVDALRKSESQPLMLAGDGNIYDPNTREWISRPGNGSGAGGFRYEGNSVEAQSLNGLIESGQLTPEQAQQLGAGKTISGPNGETIFLTPQGIFGQPAEGGAPQRIGGGSQLPIGNSSRIEAPQATNGNITVTAPKTSLDERKAMTFADRMLNSGGLLNQYENAGLDSWGQNVTGNNWIPDSIENFMVSDDFQKFDQARRDFINAQLRRESGAVISPEEFSNANQQYFPQPGNRDDVIKQKRHNRQIVIDGMVRDGGPTYQRPAPPPQNAAQPSNTAPASGAPPGWEAEWPYLKPEERERVRSERVRSQ